VRPDFDPWVMDLARVVATRGTCGRRRVGAVAVRGKHPFEVGYNGAPSGERHCAHERYDHPEDDPDLMFLAGDWRCVRARHAEVNVLDVAQDHGQSVVGVAIYSTCRPCRACTQTLIEARVGEIVTPAGPDTAALEQALLGTRIRLRLLPSEL